MLQGKHITFSYSDSAKGKIDQASEWSAEGGIGRDLFQWGKYI